MISLEKVVAYWPRHQTQQPLEKGQVYIVEDGGPLPPILLHMVRLAEAEKRLYLYDITFPNGPIITIPHIQRR